MMAYSPASFGVAVDLANARVHPEANRSYECRLAEVRTKPRPEVVIQVRPSMESSGMKRNPMSYCVEERNEKGESDDAKDEEYAKANLPHGARTIGVGVGHRPVAVFPPGHRGSRP